MRFSTVALFAASAMAGKMHHSEESSAPAPTASWGGKWGGKGKFHTTSTVYETKVYTVSDCPDTVTRCPYDKTKVVTETIAVSTTVCEVEEETEAPVYPESTSCSEGEWAHNKTMTYKPHPPKETSSPCPEDEEKTWDNKPTWATEAPACPYTKVKTISTSYTTVLPTVIYETYTEECPKAKPTKDVWPSHDAGCYGANCSSPAKPTKPVTAGAGSAVGSVLFAAAAGLAAYALA